MCRREHFGCHKGDGRRSIGRRTLLLSPSTGPDGGWRSGCSGPDHRVGPPHPCAARILTDMAKPPSPVVDVLAGIDLFAGLTRKQLGAIADECRERRFRAGTEIVAEGDTGGRLYVIRSGSAVVNVRGTEVDSIGPGAVFGEIAVIDRGPRSAQVVAVTDVDTYSL